MAEQAASKGVPARLHLNQGAYCGELIPVPAVLDQLRHEAERTGWRIQELTRSGPHPIWQFSRAALDGAERPRRIYISAGVHGDEPAGPLTALQLLQKNAWPANAEVTLFPCLNPIGLVQNQREGPEGIDFNRDYRHPRTPVVRAHLDWLQGQDDFNLALLLHEDWEADGFYLYELAAARRNSNSERVMHAVSAVCPILQAKRADDWPVRKGIVRPKGDPEKRAEWPEALYLFEEKTDVCYTLEAPSDYPMSVRVGALVTAVDAALSL